MPDLKKAEKRSGATFTLSVAERILKYRYIIFVLFAVFAVYCALSLGKVKTNGDLAVFLPRESETRRGLTVMEDEFSQLNVIRAMASDVAPEQADAIAEAIAAVENVAAVDHGADGMHYKDGNALFTISVVETDVPGAMQETADKIDNILSPYEHSVYTKLGNDYNSKLAGEMFSVMTIAVIVIALVLIFTSKSYFEVVVYAIVFVFAGLFNMGTNHWLGEISSISNTVAVILQLALAIDYAIIFAHRYQFELTQCPGSERQAIVKSLANSIKEISSSSLTTVSGLVALMLMQFRLGYDLGIVLAKGIICSMLTVFLLMPGMIYIFRKPLKKTLHRSLVPGIRRWGRLLAKKVPVFLIVFVLIVPAAIIVSGKTEYAFNDTTVTEILHSENRDSMHKIDSVFDPGSTAVLLIPSGNYDKEQAIMEKAQKLTGVSSVVGLAGIEYNGIKLTGRYTSSQLAEALGVDAESAELLYKGFRIENGDPRALWDDLSSSIPLPLADVIMYLFQKIDQKAVSLSPEQSAMIEQYRGKLEMAVSQLHGENYDRILVNSSFGAESEKSVELVETLRRITAEEYGEDAALIVGDITVSRDLRDSYKSDSVLISVLTVVFVFVILLFTFKSPVAAALLVLVIQGSIWVNFSIPYLLGMRASFVTNMIVSAIQMGATIDYAIVMMNRYQANRLTFSKQESVVRAVSESFPTLITSGSIMAMAGFLIAYRVSDVYVGHIGHAVGRGAVISVIMVLTVLPQMILLFDKAIEKTTLRIKRKKKEPQATE